MNGILETSNVKIRCISPVGDGYQYFYGYYDNPAFDTQDRRHLCNRVRFMDRLPKPGDVSELGYFDLGTGAFRVFAETSAWNFQQGSMLQWNPKNQKEAIYNIWDGGEYRCVVQNVETGEKRTLDYPVANVSADGNHGLSINFNRVYDFRPGYGYYNRRDPWYDVPAPRDDGVVLVDMQTGKGRQIISYSQLDKIYNDSPALKGAKIVINHITFNRASDRFLFLVRNFTKDGQNWRTGLGTSDLEGNVYKLRPYTYASHYFWKNDGKLLIYADCGEGEGLYELTDRTQEYVLHDRSFFTQDIHCSYSPDQKYIVGDGYPDAAHYRPVFLYGVGRKKGLLLGRFYAPGLSSLDIRCDLHCRWNHAGTMVSFDSIHEGFRGLYIMDLRDATASLEI